MNIQILQISHKKHSSGFTIIEVLIALGIVVAAFSVVISAQIRCLLHSTQDRNTLIETYFLKGLLQKQIFNPDDNNKNQSNKITIKNEHPAITTITENIPIHQKSALAPYKKSLYRIMITGESIENTKKSTIRIPYFKYNAQGTQFLDGTIA